MPHWDCGSGCWGRCTEGTSGCPEVRAAVTLPLPGDRKRPVFMLHARGVVCGEGEECGDGGWSEAASSLLRAPFSLSPEISADSLCPPSCLWPQACWTQISNLGSGPLPTSMILDVESGLAPGFPNTSWSVIAVVGGTRMRRVPGAQQLFA